MRILDRLVLASFLKLFVLFVLCAPLLFVLADATEKLDDYLNKDIPGNLVALSYAYAYPQFVFWALAIAALLATVFTIFPMTVHREIIAAKAGGISFYRLVAPILVAGGVIALLGLPFADLVPRANRRAAVIRGEAESSLAFKNDFVYLTDAGVSLTARTLTLADRQIVGLTLQSYSEDPAVPSRYIRADRAEWDPEGGWTLWNGLVREIGADGTVMSSRFESRPAPEIPETPAELLESPRDVDDLTNAELTRFAERLNRSGGDVGEVLTKRAQRLAIPMAAFVIVLFGAPLATSSKRGGTAYGIGISLATTITYVMLFRITGAFGAVGKLDPTVAAWIPNVIFLVLGIVLMLRVRS